VLAAIDLVLQVAVAVEIAVQLVRGWGGLARMQAWVVGLIPLLSLAATAAMLRLLPMRLGGQTPLPPDRIQMFESFGMILLWVCAFVWTAAPLLRRVLTGFAAYGAVNVAAMLGRSVAAMHRDGRAFVTWSYVVAGMYVAVVVWWIVTLRGDERAAAS
jgi:hypothetical protein